MLIFSTTFCGDLWVRVAGIPSLLNLTNKQPFFACLPLKTPFFSIYCMITNDTKYSVFFQKGRNVWYCDGSYQLVLCSDAMSQFRRCDKLSIEIASNHWDTCVCAQDLDFEMKFQIIREMLTVIALFALICISLQVILFYAS